MSQHADREINRLIDGPLLSLAKINSIFHHLIVCTFVFIHIFCIVLAFTHLFIYIIVIILIE